MTLSVITTIFPVQEFNTAELHELSGHMTAPVVKKYLLDMAARTILDLSTGGLRAGQTTESYMLAQAKVQGALAVLDGLIKFEPATPKAGDSEEL